MPEALIGVIIGGILSFLGGIYGAYLQHRWEIERFRRDQMKAAYEITSRTIVQAYYDYTSGEELLKTIEEMNIMLSLYGSIEAQLLFKEVEDLLVKPERSSIEDDELTTRSLELDFLMRKDLGIDSKRKYYKHTIKLNPVLRLSKPKVNR